MCCPRNVRVLTAPCMQLSEWRRDHLTGRPILRMLEAVAIAALTATCAFWAPHIMHKCHSIPAADVQDFYQRYTCAEGEYNPMASIIFATTEVSSAVAACGGVYVHLCWRTGLTRGWVRTDVNSWLLSRHWRDGLWDTGGLLYHHLYACCHYL